MCVCGCPRIIYFIICFEWVFPLSYLSHSKPIDVLNPVGLSLTQLLSHGSGSWIKNGDLFIVSADFVNQSTYLET